MATQKTTKKEKTLKEKKEIRWIQNVCTTMKNETVQFVAGLLCVMLALYMILAFSSFVLNGGADQSALERQGVTEAVANAASSEVANATGRSGAHIAQTLINGCFGISAYSIAVFLLVLGLNLMRTYPSLLFLSASHSIPQTTDLLSAHVDRFTFSIVLCKR